MASRLVGAGIMMYQGTALIRLILLGGVITWIRYPYKLPVEEVYIYVIGGAVHVGTVLTCPYRYNREMT
jgi:hypothetical protein